MITVRLMGGLGNQMFQYAAARRLALHHGTELRLDVGWFGEQPPQVTQRSYELDVFACGAEVQRAVVPLEASPDGRVLARLRRRPARPPLVVRETTTAFDPGVLALPEDVHLVGYWGSERYFADVADLIRRDFTLREPLDGTSAALYEQILATPGSVSLHVRRGDYVTNPVATEAHGVLGVDYYQRAVDRLAEPGAPLTLFVFSDDPDWCEEHLQLGHRLVVARGNDGRGAARDMVLMGACRHHVIANSTFSWWGAWLAPDQDGVVIAPVQWARDPAIDFTDVYPDRWLQV